MSDLRVAEPGSAPAWGAGRRQFESGHGDHLAALAEDRRRLEQRLAEIRLKLGPLKAEFHARKASGDRAQRPRRKWLGKQIVEFEDAICETRRQLHSLQRAMADVRNGERLVTDHALLRWLERRHGFDRGKIEAEIMAFFGVEAMSEDEMLEKDGWRAVIRERHIVTITEPEGHDDG